MTATQTAERFSLPCRPHTLSSFRLIPLRHRHGRTPGQMKAVHDARQAAKAQAQGLAPYGVAAWCRMRRASVAPANVAALPLGSEFDGLSYLRESGGYPRAAQDGRKKNWSAAVAEAGPSRVRTNNHGRYSSRCTWPRLTYTRVVESWAAVLGPKVLYWQIDGDRGVRRGVARAPRGWRWDVDENGVRLASESKRDADYHPTAGDVLGLSGHGHDPFTLARNLAKLATANAARRQAQRRQAKAEQKAAKRNARQEAAVVRRAEAEGLAVCLADSLRAGNCRAGTVTFGERLGLNPANHYRPSELAKLAAQANPDTRRRLALVVAAALRRHREEVAQGFCVIANHRA